MRDHKDLDVWKESIDLVTAVYALSKSFPPEEVYGLGSQMCRSAVSVPSNIAEGAARQTSKEFTYFLHIAAGSLAELETQIIIACKLAYVEDASQIQSSISSVRKMIYGLIRHYRNAGTGDPGPGTGKGVTAVARDRDR